MKANIETKTGSEFKVLTSRLCAFSLLGLALLMLSNECLERSVSLQSSNPYFKQYRELVNPKVNANIVILGSSRSLHGINPRYLEDNSKTAYNFSADSARGHFYKPWYGIFKKYYPKPDMAIFEIGSYWFTEKGLSITDHIDYFPLKLFWNALFNPSLLSDPDFPSDLFHPPVYKSMLRKKNKSIYLHDILTSFHPAKGETRAGYHGYLPYGEGMPNIPATEPYNSSNVAIHHFAPKRLIGLINKLLDDKIKVVLVDLPEFIPNRIRDPKIFRVLRNIAITNSNIIFLDYNSEDNVTEFNFNGKYFIDYFHMSGEGGGSTLFSKRLKHDLDEIEASQSLAKDINALSHLSFEQLTEYGRRARQRGDLATSQSYFEAALQKAGEFNPDDPRLQAALENLAGVYSEGGNLAQAESLLKRVQALPDFLHPGLKPVQNALGTHYVNRGALSLLPFDQCMEHGSQTEQRSDFATAQLYFEEALKKAEQFNPYDPRLMTTLISLARAHRKEGHLADAEPLLKRVVDFRAKNLGLSHPDLLEAQNALGTLYAEQRRDPQVFLPLLSFDQCAEYGMQAKQRGDEVLAELYFKQALIKLEGKEIIMPKLTQETTYKQLLDKHNLGELVAFYKQLFTLPLLSIVQCAEYGLQAKQRGDEGMAELYFHAAIKKANLKRHFLSEEGYKTFETYVAQGSLAEAVTLLKLAFQDIREEDAEVYATK